MPDCLPRIRVPAKRLGLRLRAFLLFAAVTAGAVIALAVGLYLGYARSPNTSALNAFITGGITAGFLILCLLIGLWRLFDENVAKPLERLAGELRARTHNHVRRELTDMKARHLGDLAPAATALMDHLNRARNELAEAVERETTQQTVEKERLIALLSDLPVGVLLCTADHRVVLYNGQALGLLGQTEAGDAPCLDRRIFDYLQETPIRQAYERLLRSGEAELPLTVARATRDTGRDLIAAMRLVVSGLLAAPQDRDPTYVIALHDADRPLETRPVAPRTVAYDFELLTKDRYASLADAPLDDLVYVVFDTETTGLLPGSGDEIVQLAAVRIVNGRRVDKEVVDVLVNPGRAIPSASTRIHGVSDAMVADAPRIDTAARRLQKFAQDAVLVAHNAAFDMAFLRRDERRIGVRFDNPVLDTVLLSAIIFGESENHSLDALTARLGVPLSEQARHTAIGDATATAEVLLKLSPALKARGIDTFGDLLAETRRHSRLLR